MAYEFSFDGKSLWALGGGSIALCLLLFFAGVLLGANWRAPEASAAKAEPEPATRPASAQPAPGAREAAATPADAPVAWLPYAPEPQGPAFYAPPTQQQEDARWYGRQPYAPQGYGAQGYGAQGYAQQAPAATDYTAQRRYAAPNAAAASARDYDAAPSFNAAREAARLRGAEADPRLVSEAETETAAPAQQTAQAGYSVQVGAYAAEPEARGLLASLENKGYTPTLFRGRDYGGRQWFAVRIGSYASHGEAAQAAQNFARQEKLQAAVRPSGSL